jgi:hypothetical protein
VAFLECYFDESGTHDGSPVLCVAGYLFEKTQCESLDLKWKETLERHHLPFFRMSACAHNQKPFDTLDRDGCIAVEKEMIGLINENALLGVAIAINESDTWFEQPNQAGSAYTFCCWQILAGIRAWIDRTKFEGEIAYFFEARHASQSEANAVHRIFSHPTLRAGYRYAGHAFVDKQKSRPSQAARQILRDIDAIRKNMSPDSLTMADAIAHTAFAALWRFWPDAHGPFKPRRK